VGGMSTAIFHPMVVLVLWTFAVLAMVPRQRFKAAREKRVRVADFAYGESENVPPEVRIPNRNFMNLLETPVLFYVACLTVYVIGKVDVWSVGLAWTYVVLRIAHSLVHLTYNHVIHRMRVYAASIFVLLALWIRILFVL
jgi:hypothetical protein